MIKILLKTYTSVETPWSQRFERTKMCRSAYSYYKKVWDKMISVQDLLHYFKDRGIMVLNKVQKMRMFCQ